MATLKSLDWPALGMLAVALVLAISGQLLMKVGMRDQRTDSIGHLARAAGRLPVLMGMACYAFSAGFYLVVLSRLDLSYVYPMVALAQVGVMLFSWLLLKEGIPPLRILGMAVVCVGVILIALSPAPRQPSSISHTYHVAEQ